MNPAPNDTVEITGKAHESFFVLSRKTEKDEYAMRGSFRIGMYSSPAAALVEARRSRDGWIAVEPQTQYKIIGPINNWQNHPLVVQPPSVHAFIEESGELPPQ